MLSAAGNKPNLFFQYPWFAAFLCVTAGAVIAYYQVWWYVLPVILALLVLYIVKSRCRISLGWVALTVAAVIFFYPSFSPYPGDLPAVENKTVVGTVASIPKKDEDRTRFVLSTGEDNRYHRQYQVVCRFDLPVHKGDRIWLTGSLKPPHRAGNPGEFDYRQYLYHQGIYYILSAEEASDVLKVERARGWQGLVNSYRDRMYQVTNQYLTAQEAAVLRGMLLGDIDDIDPELYEEFQNTGIVHLFSVSGVHVGFLLLLSGWLSSLLGAKRFYKLVAGIILLLVYGTLISWPVPVIRASIMGGMGLLAYYYGRPRQMLNSLGISGLLIILFDPHALFTISFQLSFLATWGLLHLFPVLRSRLPYSGWAVDLILVPFCAQLAVIPAIAYYFNLLSPVSILANLLVTYLSGAVVMLGFAALVLVLAAPLAGLCLLPAGLCIQLILLATHFCDSLPGGVLWVATPGVPAIAVYYAGLLLLFTWPQNSRYYKQALGVGTALILVFLTAICWPPAWQNRGTLEIVFIDVGQGDSILIKSPQGRFILVDGGGSQFYQVGEMKLLPYLRHRGINRLDLMISTHPDSDHFLGLTEILNKIAVERFAYPLALRDSPAYAEVFRQVRQQSGSLLGLQAGQVLQVEPGFYLEILHPPGEVAMASGANHFSLVLKCRYQNFAALLPGDLDREGLEELAAQKEAMQCDVVKVPHHGSRYSLVEEFYAICQPRAAIISVGNNQFGHPHEEVLDALTGQGIQIYRTDRQGLVRCTSDGNCLRIDTYLN